uniref:Immunoglobulin domain-containing protein n=1 Tax=Salarias fasciatus TaxID=181472 RepID=A0A672FQW8_SALFA
MNWLKSNHGQLLTKQSQPCLGTVPFFSFLDWMTHCYGDIYPLQLDRKVGENATFYCTEDTQRQIKLLYFQIGDEFVNGFHDSHEITVSTWPNTKVDVKAAAVHMYNLNVSHEGDYQCHIEFMGSEHTLTVQIRLRVTAPYSRPSISSRCDAENLSCMVECTSHGGYPSAELMWNATESNGSQWRGSVNSTEVRDPNTGLFSISSSAAFDCLGGKQKVSCSVNDSTSDILSSNTLSVSHVPAWRPSCCGWTLHSTLRKDISP